MWVESVEQIGSEAVGLCVERLDDAARERTAATLAWLTLDALADGTGHCPAWHAFMDDLLRQHVAFAMREERVADLGPEWWELMIARAVSQFMRANDLGLEVNRHVETMQWMARNSQGEC